MTRIPLLLLMLAAFVADAQTPHIVGTWELNQDASQLPDGFALQSDTRAYFLREDGFLVGLAVIVDAEGNPNFLQFAAKSDGKDYPEYDGRSLADLQVDGSPTRRTYSETVIDEYTVDIVDKFDGQVIVNGTRTVASDGATMTITVYPMNPAGETTTIVLVYDRT